MRELTVPESMFANYVCNVRRHRFGGQPACVECLADIVRLVDGEPMEPWPDLPSDYAGYIGHWFACRSMHGDGGECDCERRRILVFLNHAAKQAQKGK